MTLTITEVFLIIHAGSFEVIICTQKEAILISVILTDVLMVSCLHMEFYTHPWIPSQTCEQNGGVLLP